MEKIKKALNSLNVENWILCGEPTNETEFNQMFRKITSFGDSPREQVESDDPADFGVTWDEIQTEIARADAEYTAQQYARDRAAEYPPVEDYLDAIVKGDEAQKQAYIDACLAVKAKYPKPE